MLDGIARRIKAQHLGREGEEILRIEAERDDHKDRGNQEEEDRAANKEIAVMPEHLARCRIDGHAFAIIAMSDPIDHPRHNQPCQPPDHKPEKRPHGKANHSHEDGDAKPPLVTHHAPRKGKPARDTDASPDQGSNQWRIDRLACQKAQAEAEQARDNSGEPVGGVLK